MFINNYNLQTIIFILFFFRNNINSLEKDVLTAIGRADDIRRVKEALQKERDSLRSEIIKLNNTIADLRHDMMLKINMISSLNLDLNKLNVRLDEAYIMKAKSEKERDEMAQEMETLHERIENYQGKMNNLNTIINKTQAIPKSWQLFILLSDILK